MGDLLQRLQTQIKEFYGNLDRTKKVMIFGGAGLFVVIVTVLILTLTRVEWMTLVTDVSVEDAGKITTQLTAANIQWQDVNTTTIQVPKNQLSAAKMNLAQAGIYGEQDYTWTEAFAGTSITQASETRDAMFLQAQRSDLEKGIESLNFVEKATLNLYIPKDSSYFLSDNYDAKATVIIKVRNGHDITSGQVNGIISALSTSVKGLEKTNITVLDTNGEELSRGISTGDEFNATNQMEMKNAVEANLSDDLRDFLEALYGRNNVRVNPSVVLDFDTQIITSEVFAPPIEGETTGMLRSAINITEKVNSDSGSEGAPGTDSNSEATNYVESGSTASNVEKAQSTLNYELNKVVTQLEKAKGTIQSIQIAVVVNSKVLENNALSDAHRVELQQLVAAAAGTNTNVVIVSAMPFADPLEGYDIYGGETTTGISMPILFGVIGAIVVILGIVVFMILTRNRKKHEEETNALEEQLASELDEITIEEDTSSPKYQIEKFVDTNPQAVAALLRAWLNED